MLKRKKEIIAKVMATTMLASTLTSTFTTNVSAAEPQTKATVSETTIAGDDRYKTAVEISKNYSSTSKHAVIVNGEKGIVDALTATPYASLKKAPILMTQSTKLNADTKKELTRRGVKTVDIVGGVNSVSDAVKAEIEAMGIKVNRIAGDSKYDTALEVAKKIDGISNISKIAVANGEVLADAVSVAAPAAQNKMPIILAHPTKGLDAEVKKYIDGEGISTSYVIGGTSSVSTATQNSLPGTKKRLEGTDRQGTNASVIKEFYTSSSYDNMYVAKSGQVNKADEIADALAVGVLAASKQDPVMLVGKNLGSTQKTLLESKDLEKITKVGGNIPTASIDAIKATQNDPEAIVSGVTLVNYKTIKITGKELNRIDKSKVSISGNTTSSYTANSAGTEATVEFANAFSNGTNTVKVTSNLGNVTSHTFTYSTGISTVEATTKEVATEGIQYLEFTVNGGQKRSIEELKALGWTVKFQSTTPIFYKLTNGVLGDSNTSSTGQLKTNSKFTNGTTFDYEVVLTNGTQEIKSGKVAVLVKDKTSNIKSIDSYSLTFGSTGVEKQLNGSTLLVGEKAKIEKIKITNLNGTNSEKTSTSDYTLTSSKPSVVTIANGNVLEAKEEGTTTITITIGDKTKTFDLTVRNLVGNERKATSATFDTSSLNLVTGQSKIVTVTVKDQYGDPIILGSSNINASGLSLANIDAISNKALIKHSDNTVVAKATQLSPVASSIKGEYTTTVASEALTTAKSATLKVQYNGKDLTGAMTVNVTTSTGKTPTYKVEIANDSESKDLTIDKFDISDDTIKLVLNEYVDNSYLLNPAIALTSYTVESSNTNIATVTKNANYIEIGCGTSTGTAQIKVYDNSNPKKQVGSTITVTVNDNTPKIKTIQLNTVKDITELKDGTDKEFRVEELFDITKVNISSVVKNVVNNVTVEGTIVAGNNEVLLDLRSEANLPVLFIDKNNNGTYELSDQLLATIDMSTDSGITNTETTDAKRYVNLATAQKGNIIIRLYHGTYEAGDESKSPFASKTIGVNIEG